MANVRGLKKDLNYNTTELVIECFTFDFLFPETDKDELGKIIAETIALKNDLLEKINQVKATSDIPAKVQYGQIRKEMNDQLIALTERLMQLNK